MLRLFTLACAATAAAAALPPSPRVLRDVPYLGPGRREKLDLYLPAGGGALRPALVWIHGGGLVSGNKRTKANRNVAMDLARAGEVVASIDYRLGRGAWPQDILDAKNAIRFLRSRAARYGVDPDRIAVGGGSSGGYLALMAALSPDSGRFDPGDHYPGVSNRVRAVLDFYGPADFTTRRKAGPGGLPTDQPRPKMVDVPRVFGVTDGRDPVFRVASAVRYVRRGAPPVLICQGRNDPQVDYLQAIELANLLKADGVPHQLVLLDGIGHAFDLETWRNRRLPEDLRPVVANFLARYDGARATAARRRI